LKLLASSRHGANEEPLVRGYGFSRRVLAGLVSARLLAAKREVMMAGGKGVEGGEDPDYGGGAKGDRGVIRLGLEACADRGTGLRVP
jgi:hypothetical protein